ncbi:hypothetical protein [Streptomyces sp. 4F14]|uniref:hypothetical protein n=1 Tax=Streptomyces sp. 4F14 TaxID=3394380 RepID=UPI003A86A025
MTASAVTLEGAREILGIWRCRVGLEPLVHDPGHGVTAGVWRASRGSGRPR